MQLANAQEFLRQGPPFSKSRVNREADKWRDGLDYDPEPIEEFLAFNALHAEALLGGARHTISSLLINVADNADQSVRPNTRAYSLSARVKTKSVLLEKLRRMGGTPLLNVHDVAGIRFDCDLSLSQQAAIAESFKADLEAFGAKRVDIKDFRDAPHSGYRAIHLHIRSTAGRSELQIRTALQSKWANLYEEAADLYGREIRYLHEGADMPPGAGQMVQALQKASMLVAKVEGLAGGENHWYREKPCKLSEEAYRVLDGLHAELKQQRVPAKR
ncbi:GTP pyrophosphokinase [Corynebacterium lizhenjunii]|uniref:GTP pyrophosphokinase n=2 Tax=Corynebacterium lizhenjunii TaxID=2709394 RepID=A0A7T0PCB4_9CORY|nr:GTP pyrophosphokinase [Corynebacterium lizhenjunii]